MGENARLAPRGFGVAPTPSGAVQMVAWAVVKLDGERAVPKTVRVGVLWNPNSQAHPRMLKEAEAPARTLGLRLQRVAVSAHDGYDRAFATMTEGRAEALVVLGDPIFWHQRSRFAELATKHRLPGMFGQREHVKAGGLMSYGANVVENFRRAAHVVDKILKGARPADIRVEQPTKFELVINLKTAKAATPLPRITSFALVVSLRPDTWVPYCGFNTGIEGETVHGCLRVSRRCLRQSRADEWLPR